MPACKHYRLTPAGMDTANKVGNLRKGFAGDGCSSNFNFQHSSLWLGLRNYVCDYKVNRFSNYLFKARCKTSSCSGNCNQENNSHNRCQSHGILVTVLEMRGNCGEWVWGQELLPIACTSTSNVMMNAKTHQIVCHVHT